jgi:folate-binding protein YgfZ
MEPLSLHAFHEQLGARFAALNGSELVADYGNAPAEYDALQKRAGVLDLSFRGRLCLTGADRVRFLHGQVTNDVQRLAVGEGCYAALTTAKARMQSDLNIYRLQDELLLDFEPGLSAIVSQRLEKYIIADDVQLVEVAPHYGLLSVQGPAAAEAVRGLAQALPGKPWASVKATEAGLGEVYCMNRSRGGGAGFDLFVPAHTLAQAAERLVAAARDVGGCACGWTALEMARIEAGLPRFGQDIDETNIPLEAGLEGHAISFNKGCYIGQEIISRIQTYSEVARALRRLLLAPGLQTLPAKGDKLIHSGKEVGYITSALASPSLNLNIALGYVRKEVNQVGTELAWRHGESDSPVRILGMPFQPFERAETMPVQ